MTGKSRSIDPNQLLSHSGWLRKLAYSLVQDPDRAEDLQQDALLAALEARSMPAELAEDRQLRAWLARVTRNLSYLGRRSEDRRRSREQVVAKPEPTRSAAEVVERASRLRLIVDRVMELEEPSRSCILLRYFEGLSTREIAAETGASEAAVRQRISRGLGRMRSKLDGMHDGDRMAWFSAIAPLAGLVNVGSEAASAAPVLSRAWKLKNFGGTATVGMGVTVALLSGAAWLGLFSPADPGPQLLAAQDEGSHALTAEAADIATAMLSTGRQPITRWSEPGFAPEQYDSGWRHDDPERERLVRTDQERRDQEQSGHTVQRVSGHVVDLLGRPVAGLEVVASDEATEVLGQTDVGGAFGVELELEQLERTLVVVDEEYTTLSAAHVTPGNHAQSHTLVVAAGLTLEGRVFDAEGNAAAGVELCIEYGDGFFSSAPMPLDRGRVLAPADLSGTGGRFALAGLFEGPDVWVVARQPGSLILRQPVTSFGAELELHLQAFLPAAATLAGTVQDTQGVLLVGTVVKLGDLHTTTDENGRFVLPADAAQADAELLAYKTGFKLARVNEDELELGSSKEMMITLQPGWSFGGEVLDTGGGPGVGWNVVAVPSGDLPHGELDSLLGPDEFAYGTFAQTDSTGEFRFDGLTRENYVVTAWNPATNEVAQSGVVSSAAGQKLVVQSEFDALQASLEGRVQGPDGEPLAQAELMIELDFNLPIGAHGLHALTVLTDDTGAFALSDVPRRFVRVRVNHESSLEFAKVLNEDMLRGGKLMLSMSGRRSFRVEDAADWRSFIVTDASGRRLSVVGAEGSHERFVLEGGRSPVLDVSAAATDIEFIGADGSRRNIPLQLVPQGVVDLRP